jgi:phage gp45-like
MRGLRPIISTASVKWTFKTGMREAGREALTILRHEANEEMAHSQYRHFLSRAEEGAEAVILPAGGHDHMGCFTDQVKLTHALV